MWPWSRIADVEFRASTRVAAAEARAKRAEDEVRELTAALQRKWGIDGAAVQADGDTRTRHGYLWITFDADLLAADLLDEAQETDYASLGKKLLELAARVGIRPQDKSNYFYTITGGGWYDSGAAWVRGRTGEVAKAAVDDFRFALGEKDHDLKRAEDTLEAVYRAAFGPDEQRQRLEKIKDALQRYGERAWGGWHRRPESQRNKQGGDETVKLEIIREGDGPKTRRSVRVHGMAGEPEVATLWRDWIDAFADAIATEDGRRALTHAAREIRCGHRNKSLDKETVTLRFVHDC